ncbi:alpha/beta fold hydrolase [Actibacterium ureilyticum]|uniref:alpha/beta fold hydrolase n=1 Tax=Actibacterium ureilyticum TaxID=1590614 RepID=UPI000BAB0D55|nr:alpha/beta fold hydrolase [Actibacterium ureilyticum]
MSDALPILLVHGAWGSAESWGTVPARLRAKGFRVNAIDLPGHGHDPTPPETVRLSDYADRIVDALQGRPPALVVGHSMGGMAITAAAEQAPERFRALVYLCAFLPRDGDSLLSLKKREAPTIGAAVQPGPVPGTTVLDPDRALPFLAQDADPATRSAIRAGLQVQPNRAQTDPVRLSSNRFGMVPKIYVRCLRDQTITPELQQAMATETRCDRILSLDSGHLPQMTQAAALTDLLAGIARDHAPR